MRIGQLLKFNPRYPTMSFIQHLTSPGPLDCESIVILVDQDGVGFRSQVLIGDQKIWVRNTDLFEVIDSDMEQDENEKE